MANMQNVAGRVLLFTLAGLTAGLLTWLLSDVSGLIHIGDTVSRLGSGEAQAYWVVFASWGGFIGVLLSVADTMLSGSPPNWLKTVGIGALVGMIAGMIGGALGMGAFSALYVFPANNAFDFFRNVVGRAAGWAFIGGLAGTAPGWRKWSLPVGRNGFIGGLIGGILGGSTFEIIPYLLVGMSRPGPVARLFGFAITGAMIGLFVALVQELLKEAWVRVMVGRNEGKEILVEKQETSIGRYELSDITLFGDPKVARTHALLLAQPGGRFILRDTGESPLGILVNGQKIGQEAVVKNGDQIQIAGKLLIFYERFTKTPTAPAPRDVAEPRSMTYGGSSLADLPMPGAGIGGQAAGIGASISASPQTAFLSVLSGAQAGARFALRSGMTIGRDPNADIPLAGDTKASRIHTRLIFERGWIAEDAGSTNGTFVNGQRVNRQPLAQGDTVVIGTTSFQFDIH